MEYKIPKSTIRSFIDVLKDTKRTLEIIKIETTKEKESVSTRFLISNQKIKSKEEEQEIKLEFDLCNLVLKIIDKLELAIDKLISSYNQKEFKEYIPFFDVIVACLGTQNCFVAMIILDVIKNNARFSRNRYNETLEKKMASLIEGYQIKASSKDDKVKNTDEFIKAYNKYLQNGYQIIKYLTKDVDYSKELNKQVQFMQDSLENLPSSYALYTEINKKKNNYVTSNAPVFTENNEVKYYMSSGKVIHLCEPKMFNDLLIKNGYSDKARYTMLKKMIMDISMPSKEEGVIAKENLVADTLAKIDVKYKIKWSYIRQNEKYYSYDILKEFYKYFYMVSGIDEGYGYTNDDINEFMLMELDIVYARMNGPKMDKSLKRKM